MHPDERGKGVGYAFEDEMVYRILRPRSPTSSERCDRMIQMRTVRISETDSLLLNGSVPYLRTKKLSKDPFVRSEPEGHRL